MERWSYYSPKKWDYTPTGKLSLRYAPWGSGHDGLRKTWLDASQKLGKIQINKEWDIVVLVLLDKSMEPVEIYEADRKSVVNALIVPGSKARNERGQLSISKFKSIGKKVWG